MGLKLRQIEAFRAVMREGSMVRAASVLFVTQPAVSYLISTMETAVGFPLFVRAAGKLSPTPEAYQLASEVDRLYEGLDGIEVAAKLIANHQKAVLRLLLTSALSSRSIVSVIGRYAAAHPGIRLDIDVAHRAAVVRRVAGAQADLGLVSLPVESNLAIATPLFASPLVCVVPRTGSTAALHRATPTDLSGHALVALKSSGTIRPLVDRWFQSGGVTPRIEIEARHAWVAIDMARAGVGIAIVSRLSLPEAIESDASVTVLPLEPEVSITIGAVTPLAQQPHRAVQSLLEHLREQVR
jgi:DNA-binding transcriptional LysR family regulator